MTRRPTLLLALLLISAVFLSSAPYSTVASQHDNRITAPVVVNPALTPGSRLSLTMSIFDIGPSPEDLDGWEVHVSLNASVLNILGVRDGPVLDEEAFSIPGGDTLNTFIFNATEGTVAANEILYTTSPPLPSNLGFTGRGELFYIDVEVLSIGWTFITLIETKLRDVDVLDFVAISHGAQNGAFSNVDHVFPPTASFAISPATVFAGDLATFDASASYDLDGNITQYQWDFGDSFQATETDPIAVHTYLSPSPYNVTLIVTDDDGATDTTTRRLVIAQRNLPPIAVFSFTPGNPEVFEPVTFDATASYDPEGRLAQPPQQPYLWDFGDGSTSGGLVVQHTYMRAGIYTVILTVVDDRGQRGVAQQQVPVSQGPPNEPPVASFIFEPTDPHVGETVRFDATNSFDSDGFVADYTWNFGDGGFGAGGQVVYHTYFSPGTFVVTLQVRDNRGQFASTSSQITVAPRPEHDVGIDNIIVSPSGRLVSGQFAVVTVIVENVGSHDENVTVRAYYDGALIGSVTQRVFGSPFYVYYAYITIFWDTSGVAAGEYTISAEAQIAHDEDLSNNVFTNGQLTILPPPRLDSSPPSGPVGTRVTVTGTGLPETPFPQGLPRPILVSFDNQFIGYAFTTGTDFVFIFNIPEAEAGLHRLNVLDVLTLLRVSVDFTVVDETMLEVGVDVGSFYFEGDTALATVQVQRNGHLVEPTSIQATLLLPDGTTQTLSLRKVEGTTGLYRIEIPIAARNSIGTYAVNVEAIYHSDYSDSRGHALNSFTVKTVWLSPARIRTASLIGSIGSVGLIGPVVFKTYLDRKARRRNSNVEGQPSDTSPSGGDTE